MSLQELIENQLLSVAINPILKRIISLFDIDCESDGSLLVNSLKQFLGDNTQLCNRCSIISNNIARHFYHIGGRIMRADKVFMENHFLEPKYGDVWLKGFALMMKGIRKYGIRIPFTPAGPFEVVWNFTARCNLRCKHCYEDAGKNQTELSTEDSLRVVDKLSEIASIGLPAISFSGGEPLIRKDFFEVAKYASKKIPFVSIATNGVLLTEETVQSLLDLNINYVEISLDGATKEVHEGFRRVPGCFEKTMKGIENCIAAGLDTCIATTIHRENLKEFEKIIELVDKLDTRFIHFNYIPTGRAKAFVELDLTPEERFFILESLGRKIINLFINSKQEEEREGRSGTRVDRFFSTCPQYASVVKKIAREKKEKLAVTAHYATMKGVENIANFLGGCGAARLYICLEPNGDIKPCVFFNTNNDIVRGNILEDNFEEIWDYDKVFWKIRTRENLKSYRIGRKIVGCGNCEDKYICGGCRARSYSYFNGDIENSDIGCIDNREIWSRISRYFS